VYLKYIKFRELYNFANGKILQFTIFGFPLFFQVFNFAIYFRKGLQNGTAIIMFLFFVFNRINQMHCLHFSH